MHCQPTPSDANTRRSRTIISAFLAFLLLLGMAPFIVSRPSLAEANEDRSVSVVIHFKDADQKTVDFAEYAVPVMRGDTCLTATVTPAGTSIDYADALKFSVYTDFAAFQNCQADITDECSYDPDTNQVTIPLAYEDDLDDAAIVFWLSPAHEAYDLLVASQFDTSGISITRNGSTVHLASNIEALKSQASSAGQPQASALFASDDAETDESSFLLNPSTRLEEFGKKQKQKQEAYGFPANWIGSYSFGALFGTHHEFQSLSASTTDWDATVLDPATAAQYPALEDYLASTIAARLGESASFAMKRRASESYGEPCITRGGSFQDDGFLALEAPVGKAMARGTCGSSEMNNDGGTPIPRPGGTHTLTFKGVYDDAESPYYGWNTFYYSFETQSHWTGNIFQDVVGYLLVPPYPGGRAQLTKVSTDQAISNANSNYSLENGVFAAFMDEAKAQHACGLAQDKPWTTPSAAKVWAEKNADICFVTTATGTSNLVEKVVPGDYFVVELLEPKGFRLSSSIVPFSVHAAENDGDVSCVTFHNDPQNGSIDLLKQSNNPAVAANNEAYSLRNATYGVFTDAACLNQYATLTTSLDSAYDGYARLDRVPIGQYWVKETMRPEKGYALDTRVYPLMVTDRKVVRVNGYPVIDKAKINPLEILLTKKDAQSRENFAQGAATLGDAHFRINYYGIEEGTLTSLAEQIPRASWVVRTNDEGSFLLSQADGTFIHRAPDGSEQELPYFVGGDSFYRLTDKRFGLPLGTYTVQEVKAPEGYLLDGTIHVRHVKDADHNNEIVETFQAEQGADMLTNQVVRADLSFQKRANGTTKLTGIPFKITSKTTGEWHIVVTDKNGQASTAVTAAHPHTVRTNSNDAQFKAEDGSFAMPLVVDSAALDATAGIWFGLNAAGESVPVDDALGALPFDTYELEELRCPGNAPFQMIRDEVTVDATDACSVIDLGTLNNVESAKPSISTSARDLASGTHEGVPAEQVTVIDAVTYQGLTPGEPYRLHAVLINKHTGKPLTVEGVPVTADCPFVAEGSVGTVDVQLDIEGANLDDATLVVFETLLYHDEEIVLHADINNEEQTVTYARPEEPLPPTNDSEEEPDNPPDDTPTIVQRLAQTSDGLLAPLGFVAVLAVGGAALIVGSIRKRR